MAKKRRKRQGYIICKKCDYEFAHASDEGKKAVKKTWTKVAPMPDSEGRVTIVMMATYNCPSCGKNIMASYGKTKGDFEAKSRKELIQDKLSEDVSFDLEEFAEAINSDTENLEKMLGFMIKKGMAKGKLVDGQYVV